MNNFINKDILEYSEKYSQQEPEILQELNRETHLKILNPRMLSGFFQGRLLSIISKLLKPKKVLEIGTGSGYQAAILAQLVEKVYSVERIKPLQEKARKRLSRLDIKNVRLIHSDGRTGLAEFAPYNAILSAAAPHEVPGDLLKQLAPNGILIIPVGTTDDQELRVITRDGESLNFREKVAQKVRFVPLVKGLSN